MNQKDIELLNLAIEFSSVIEVAPPTTPDIGVWWDRALKEMQDFWVFGLLENGAFTQNMGKTVQAMRQKLIEEAEKRQLLNTLA